MVKYLDGLEGVAAYAWFMDEVGNLVNSDGSLTAPIHLHSFFGFVP